MKKKIDSTNERKDDKQLSFIKMQATGNDFVFIDALHGVPLDQREFTIWASNRKFGIGADGVIFLSPSKRADFLMEYRNADGSETTCGNGLRCVGRYLFQQKLLEPERRECAIETVTGIVTVHVLGNGDRVRVDMGEPVIDGSKIPTRNPGRQLGIELEALGKKYKISAIGMGNPHAVIFLENGTMPDLPAVGPAIEKHPFFPQGTNVEFVTVHSRESISLRVWERGVGETLSCGTGACSAVVAGVLLGKLEPQTVVKTAGGKLEVFWDRVTNRVHLTGGAEEVYRGQVFISDIVDKIREVKR